jgi:hypothetical protein
MIALGVDPDLHHAGVALVSADGINRPKVLWVGVALAPRKLKSYAAASALDWPMPPQTHDLLVVEGQKNYPHSPVRPDDLMHLAFAAGVARGHYRTPLLAAKIPLPQEWKGTVPKDIAHARILSRVVIMPQVVEFLEGPHKSHVIDAIGLALFGLGVDSVMKATGAIAGPRALP